MKAQYINPFLNAALNLFQTHLGLKIKAGTPYLLDHEHQMEEISAIIGLAGETTGAVVLSFSRETAIQLVSRFSGLKIRALTNDVLDGVGEMINIIAGNAKKDMEEFKIAISLPGVITGSSYRIHWPEGVPVISIPFQSDLGNFSVNVSLKELAGD